MTQATTRGRPHAGDRTSRDPMLLAVAIAAAAATVPVAGGRLGRLAELRLRRTWLVAAAVALQVAISPLGAAIVPAEAAPVLHVASYVLLGAFVVANRRVPGLALIGLGGAANFAAIAANGGVMPASRSALAAAGLLGPGATHDEGGRFLNSAPVPDARLPFLGDVLAVPASWPLSTVFSAGDVLIVVGAAVLLHRVCGSRLAPGARRAAGAEAGGEGFEPPLPGPKPGVLPARRPPTGRPEPG